MYIHTYLDIYIHTYMVQPTEGGADTHDGWCGVAFGGKLVERTQQERRCGLTIMAQPLAVGQHTARLTVHSSATGRRFVTSCNNNIIHVCMYVCVCVCMSADMHDYPKGCFQIY